MESDSSSNVSARVTQYDKLVADYHSIAVKCQACHDQLAAAERELRLVARQMNGQTPDVNREIDAAQSKLLDGEPDRSLWNISHLSHREREVFALIGEGRTTHEIAEELSLATSTIETYRERVKSKLKLSSGSALVRQAVLWSISRDLGHSSSADCHGNSN